MQARVRWTDGLQFVAEGPSGKALVMDGEPENGGRKSGNKPMEMLLMALGGCVGMAAISILKKKKQDVTGFEINVSAVRSEKSPEPITSMNIEFIVKGKGLDDTAVKRSCEIAKEKYCPVGATLEQGMKITWSYKIEEM